MKKSLFIFLFLILYLLEGYAQEHSQEVTDTTHTQAQATASTEQEEITEAYKTNVLALKYLEYRASQSPNHTYLKLQKAMAYLYTGNYAKAATELDEIVALGTNNAEVSYFRGVAKENINQYQEALAHFEEAIQQNGQKRNPFHIAKRGIAYYKTGLYEKALIDLSEAYLAFPQNGNIEEWLKATRRRKNGDSTASPPALEEGDNYRYSVNDNILLYFDSLTSLQRADTAVYYKRAYAYFFLGRYEDAIKDFDRAINGGNRGGRIEKPARPNADWYYFKAIAKLSIDEKETKDALSNLDIAINMTKTKPNYFYHWKKGEIYFNATQYAFAREEVTKAQTLNPNEPEIQALMERIKYWEDGRGSVVEEALIKELINVTYSRMFRTIVEGKAMYDSIKKMSELSFDGQEKVFAVLRKKLLTDVYTTCPEIEQIEELELLVATKRWLSPQGGEFYQMVYNKSCKHFTVETKMPTYIYHSTIQKDTARNKEQMYDIRVEMVKAARGREQPDLEFTYTTMIMNQKTENKDLIVLKLYHSYPKDNVIWLYNPECYLQLSFNRNLDIIKEEIVGNFKQFASLKLTKSKAELLKRDLRSDFSVQSAIAKAVEIMLVAYEEIKNHADKKY